MNPAAPSRTAADFGRAAVRQVYLLALIGVIVGAGTFAVLHATRGDVERANGIRDVTQRRVRELGDISADVRRKAESRIAAASVGDAAPPSSRLRAVLDGRVRAAGIKDAGCDILPLVAAAKSLDVLVERASTTYRQRVENKAAIDRLKHEALGRLTALRAALQSAEGVQKLALISKQRQLDRAGDGVTRALVAELVGVQRSSAVLGSFSAEVAEVAVLIEALAGARQADMLTDIKDNRIETTLARLAGGIDRFPPDSRMLAETLGNGLVALRATIFGGDPSRSDPASPVGAGLYEEVRRQFTINDEELAVAKATADAFLALGTASDAVESELRSGHSTAEAQAARAVESAYDRTRLGGTVAIIIFIVVALRVARTVRAQVHALEESNRALDDAITEAKAASSAKSEFLAMMSHELRTPLNGVLGLSHILEETRLDDEQRDLLSSLKASGELQLAVVNDILDFSKIEAGMLSIESIPVRLADIARDIEALIRPRADQAAIRFDCSIEPTLPARLLGDPTRLRQVVLNLVGNAVKFTKKGGVRVDYFIVYDRPSPTFAIEVSDTGIGMTQETLTRLFKPFQQADGSMTRRYGGTGLGLSISKKLVELMNGSIAVRSAEGKGSVFRIELPLRPAFDSTTGLEVSGTPETESGKNPAAADAVRRHVLVVEDNAINRRIATTLLAKFGCTTEVAVDGVQAVEAASRSAFDMILMDCQMPEMDGFEATRRIREREMALGLKRGYIVALTANARGEDRERCLESGMDEFLSKPFKPADLQRLVEGVPS